MSSCQAEAPAAERGDAAGAREQIALHENVIGDGDDIELPRLPVQIDDLPHREPAVAPARVHVEVAEEEGLVAGHYKRTSTCDVSAGRWRTISAREVADVEAEHPALAERDVAPRRRVEIAVVGEHDITRLEQAAPDVGVFAVELDRGVEPADALERAAACREVAAVEDGAAAEQVLHQRLRERSERVVVGAHQQAAPQIPVIEPVRAGQRHERALALEAGGDAVQPPEWRAAVGIDVEQDVSTCGQASRLARDDQALAGLVDHTNGRHPLGHPARAVRARVVHDEDLVRKSSLRQKGVQAGAQISGFVMRADDDAECQRHRCALRLRRCRGMPTRMLAITVGGAHDTDVSATSRFLHQKRGGDVLLEDWRKPPRCRTIRGWT